FHKDFDKLDVRYGMLVEPRLFIPALLQPTNEHNRDYRHIAREYRSFIASRPDIQFFVHLSKLLFRRGPNVNYVFRRFPRGNELAHVLSAPNLFTGSFHAALALASYLGFSKIYLL